MLDAAQADLRRAADNNTTQPEDTAHGQPTTTYQGAQQIQEDSHVQHPPGDPSHREDDRISIGVQISAASEDNQSPSSANKSRTATTANEVPSSAAEPTAATTNNNNGSQPSKSARQALRYARLFALFPTPGLQRRFISHII
jgi:hypothetical protein